MRVPLREYLRTLTPVLENNAEAEGREEEEEEVVDSRRENLSKNSRQSRRIPRVREMRWHPFDYNEYRIRRRILTAGPLESIFRAKPVGNCSRVTPRK